MTIRKLINLVKGRRQIADDSMNYESVEKMLGEMNPHLLIKIKNYTHGNRERNVFETRLMLDEHFNPGESSKIWFEGNHQAYEGKDVTRHYLDISKGHTGQGLCKYTGQVLQWRESPECKAILEWEEIK